MDALPAGAGQFCVGLISVQFTPPQLRHGGKVSSLLRAIWVRCGQVDCQMPDVGHFSPV